MYVKVRSGYVSNSSSSSFIAKNEENNMSVGQRKKAIINSSTLNKHIENLKGETIVVRTQEKNNLYLGKLVECTNDYVVIGEVQFRLLKDYVFNIDDITELSIGDYNYFLI